MDSDFDSADARAEASDASPVESDAPVMKKPTAQRTRAPRGSGTPGTTTSTTRKPSTARADAASEEESARPANPAAKKPASRSRSTSTRSRSASSTARTRSKTAAAAAAGTVVAAESDAAESDAAETREEAPATAGSTVVAPESDTAEARDDAAAAVEAPADVASTDAGSTDAESTDAESTDVQSTDDQSTDESPSVEAQPEPPAEDAAAPVVESPTESSSETNVLAHTDAEPPPAAASVVAPRSPRGKSPARSTPKARAPRKPRATPTPPPAPEKPKEVVLKVEGLLKRFGDKTAVAGIDLEITAGSFFGLVGPNGAGKTTTLSMVTGLLRPDAGTVNVHGADVWKDPVAAKRNMGVLPDRLRLFDRLTGAQLLRYSGQLRGLDKETVRKRASDLSAAFGLDEALDRLVTDYSAGMTKKIALAAAMIHSPRLLVLDEPFESVDPVSAANVTEILQRYVAAGGTVVLSSHSMDLVQRICDTVGVVVHGVLLANGSMDEVRAGKTLEERFVELAGGRTSAEGLEWLNSFSD